jgi:hypothetical protein
LEEPIESYLIDGSASIGIDSIDAIGEPFSVGRYAAVFAQGQFADLERSCAIFIEVRPGQTLHVDYGYDGVAKHMTHDLACQKAKPVAEMVVANLDRGGN